MYGRYGSFTEVDVVVKAIHWPDAKNKHNKPVN